MKPKLVTICNFCKLKIRSIVFGNVMEEVNVLDKEVISKSWMKCILNDEQSQKRPKFFWQKERPCPLSVQRKGELLQSFD